MRSIVLFATILVSGICHAIDVNYTVQPATCGACNGGISVNASGGVGAYTFIWSPAPAAGQGTNAITGLCPGTWSIEVADSNGDVIVVFIDVEDLPGLNVTDALASSMVSAACPGSCNGQLTMNENLLGGSAPYSYVTNPPMPLNGICGDVPFDLTITDANGCTATITMMVPEVDIPSLLFTETIGNCGEAPTSVVAHFDDLGWWLDPFNITVFAPNGIAAIQGSGEQDQIEIDNGIPGVYTIVITPYPPCSPSTYSINYPALITDCATVSGDLFVDVNGDCINNAGDFGLANRVVDIAPGYAALTGQTGHYELNLADGSYDLSYTDPIYTQDCPIASPINLTVDQFTPATIDLALTPGPDPEVEVSLVLGQAVVGFDQDIWITITNNGGVPSGPITLTLDHDPLLTYCQFWICTLPPYSQPIEFPYSTSFVPGQLSWNLPEALAPGQSRLLTASLCLPPDPLLLGTTLDYTATANLLLNDADLTNNVSSNTETIVGSYDPNDKTGRTTGGSTSEWSMENDSLITYTIRFQNTGTAPAVNVVLIDTISSDLDLSTLKILGASHTYSTSLNDRVLSFHFDHIMLPDSNSNEAGSHGFAQFTISPLQMMAGSSVENFADIYFDFNPPVRTNTSVITAPLNTTISGLERCESTIFPNPGTDHFTLQLPPGQHDLMVFDPQGRLALQRRLSGDQQVIDTSGLQSGIYHVLASDRYGHRRSHRWVKADH
jgi:hypothetical protein